ncbi:MAG: hypothetical protein ACTSYA_08155 [Candidatus Kariarchaeaceae archaeon]
MSKYDPFDYFVDSDDYITFELNSETEYWDDKFIMPLEGTWSNGTTGNFIELYYEAVKGYTETYHSIKIEDGEIIMKYDFEDSVDFLGFQIEIIQHDEIRYDLATCVLNYHYTENNFFGDVKLEIVRAGYTAPERDSDDASFSSIWFISIGVLAIPVISRRRKD